MLEIAICEDEQADRERLQGMLYAIRSTAGVSFTGTRKAGFTVTYCLTSKKLYFGEKICTSEQFYKEGDFILR